MYYNKTKEIPPILLHSHVGLDSLMLKPLYEFYTNNIPDTYINFLLRVSLHSSVNLHILVFTTFTFNITDRVETTVVLPDELKKKKKKKQHTNRKKGNIVETTVVLRMNWKKKTKKNNPTYKQKKGNIVNLRRNFSHYTELRFSVHLHHDICLNYSFWYIYIMIFVEIVTVFKPDLDSYFFEAVCVSL